MARKKDFSTVDTGRVYNALEESIAAPEEQDAQDTQEVRATRKPRKTYTEEEAQELIAAGNTRGKKGVKAIRINMAFSPEIHDFIKVMARARGETITDFTNHVIASCMDQYKDLYEQAKKFKDAF